MSNKAEEIIKNVNATMSLEGMPLTEDDKDLIAKIVDEITIDEAINILNKKFLQNG